MRRSTNRPARGAFVEARKRRRWRRAAHPFGEWAVKSRVQCVWNLSRDICPRDQCSLITGQPINSWFMAACSDSPTAGLVAGYVDPTRSNSRSRKETGIQRGDWLLNRYCSTPNIDTSHREINTLWLICIVRSCTMSSVMAICQQLAVTETILLKHVSLAVMLWWDHQAK